MVEKMKERYGTFKGACGLDVASINDYTVCSTTQVLANNVLRKYHKDQVLTGVIATTEQCVNEFKCDGNHSY
jgi:hypothetical protein